MVAADMSSAADTVTASVFCINLTHVIKGYAFVLDSLLISVSRLV